MDRYVELPFNKKLNLLNDHDGGWPDLEHQKWCLHCGQAFTGHSVRVSQDDAGRFWLECGTPGCDGSTVDWAEFPWWDEHHPLTQARLKDDSRAGRRTKGSAKAKSKSKTAPRDFVDEDDIPF